MGPAPGSAEPYVRVYKNGVIYYYFASREPTQPGRAGKNAPKLRGEAWVQGPSPPLKLPPPAVNTPVRLASANLAAAAPLAAPESTLSAGASGALPVAASSDLNENFGAAARYLLSVLTKLGSQFSPVLPPFDPRSFRAAHQYPPASQEPPVIIPERRPDPLQSAQESRFAWGRWQLPPGYASQASSFPYVFPVAGPFSFRDTWGDNRSGGRYHRAVDIFAAEGTPVYAITAGVIQTLATLPEAGITLLMRGQDGRGYGYMHLLGYAAGVVEGKAIRTGELLGYVGRTGLQQSAAHLHFQVYADHRLARDGLLNPYYFLVQLCHGVGVTDFYQSRTARLENPEAKTNRIQVYRQPGPTVIKGRSGQLSARKASVLVIKNF